MSLTVEREQDHVICLHLEGRLRKTDVERCQAHLEFEIARSGPIRLLILLRDFSGWSPDTPWNHLGFHMSNGEAIERVAIVGPERWRCHMLMFAGAGVRRAPVEFFPNGPVADARDWLVS